MGRAVLQFQDQISALIIRISLSLSLSLSLAYLACQCNCFSFAFQSSLPGLLPMVGEMLSLDDLFIQINLNHLSLSLSHSDAWAQTLEKQKESSTCVHNSSNWRPPQLIGRLLSSGRSLRVLKAPAVLDQLKVYWATNYLRLTNL